MRIRPSCSIHSEDRPTDPLPRPLTYVTSTTPSAISVPARSPTSGDSNVCASTGNVRSVWSRVHHRPDCPRSAKSGCSNASTTSRFDRTAGSSRATSPDNASFTRFIQASLHALWSGAVALGRRWSDSTRQVSATPAAPTPRLVARTPTASAGLLRDDRLEL